LAQFLQLALSGIAIGCVYALVALGFVLIYKATETVNFAQGDLMMLGGFFAYTTTTLMGMPYWIGIIVALIAMALFGMLCERIVLRPVLGQAQFTVVMVTIGVGYVMRGVVTMMPGWGTDTFKIVTPFAETVVHIGGAALALDQLMIIVDTALLCAALFLFFRYTRVGIAMQATSQNQLAAYYMGIPVSKINTLIWGLSAAVANMGFIGLKAFPAAVVGGFGSIPGAIVGGIIIGLVESFAGFYLPEGFKDIAAYIVVLIVLMVKPSGLFGEKLRKKV
jgi:branched-chain amino acid transport system permease protein